MSESELEELVTPKGIIESNFNYETKLANSLNEEIDEIDDFLEFILTNKPDLIRFSRNVRVESPNDSKRIPSDFYDCGNEKNITYQDTRYSVNSSSIGGLSWSSNPTYNMSNLITWIEWKLLCFNENDTIEITITPFSIEMLSRDKKENMSDSIVYFEDVKIFTNKIFLKWNDKLETIIINRKKTKIGSIMSKCNILLGIDRKAKIKKILKNSDAI